MQAVVEVDEDRFAGRNVALEFETQRIERHGFGGDEILCAIGRVVTAEDHRPDAVRIAEGQQTVAGDHRHHCISAPTAAMHALNR